MIHSPHTKFGFDTDFSLRDIAHLFLLLLLFDSEQLRNSWCLTCWKIFNDQIFSMILSKWYIFSRQATRSYIKICDLPLQNRERELWIAYFTSFGAQLSTNCLHLEQTAEPDLTRIDNWNHMLQCLRRKPFWSWLIPFLSSLPSKKEVGFGCYHIFDMY